MIDKAIIIFLLIISSSVFSSTLYVGSGETYTNIQAGIAAMSTGDTLIIKNGTYTGSTNMIDTEHRPPSGNASTGFTVIKGETIGGVIIDGEDSNTTLFINADIDSVVFENLIFQNSATHCFGIYGAEYGSIHVEYIKVKNCGFCDAGTDGINGSGNDAWNLVSIRYSDYLLMEDCFAWGNRHYSYLILDSQHSILRRCLDRLDRGYGGPYSNMASFRLYSTSFSEVQNCISIDADQLGYILQTDVDSANATPNVFYLTYNPSTGLGAHDNVMQGCIALNNTANVRSYVMSLPDVSNNLLKDCIFWNVSRGIWVRDDDQLQVENCTIGEICGTTQNYGFSSDYSNMLDIKNSLIYNTVGTALTNCISDYNALYSNGSEYSGTSTGIHDICNSNSNAIDPIDGTPGNGTTALKYLCQIESGSDVDGAGEDGADIGANILYKIGLDGTFYGEPGYDSTTINSLWPYPNEDVIQTKLKVYTHDGGNLTGDRGFCADGETLTNYIWDYLGNGNPYGNDTTAPSYTATLTLNGIDSVDISTLNFSSDTAIDTVAYPDSTTFIHTGTGVAWDTTLALPSGYDYKYLFVKAIDDSANVNYFSPADDSIRYIESNAKKHVSEILGIE